MANAAINRFQHIRIQGCRRLRDVAVEIRPLTILIGANGAGKTSFLEVLSLLAASANGVMAAMLSYLGGLNDLLTRDRADHLSFDLSMSVPGHAPLDYHLRLEPHGPRYQIAEETLTQRNKPAGPPMKYIQARGDDIRYYNVDTKKLLRPNWDHSPLETSLAQVPKMFQEPENFRQKLASLTFYGPLDVSPRAPIRLPQALRPATLPGVQGQDLVSCLFSLRESDRDRFEVLEDTLRTAFPDFQRLDFPPAAAGMLAMTWKDKNYSSPMYMHQLSEGTLRFLWLAALLNSRDLTAITLIDEPEVSLHPELLNLLVQLMREASDRTQLVVATHSDRLIRFAKPEEVLVVDLQKGESSFTWGDAMDLEHWLADFSLDELWQMNRLGGRP